MTKRKRPFHITYYKIEHVRISSPISACVCFGNSVLYNVCLYREDVGVLPLNVIVPRQISFLQNIFSYLSSIISFRRKKKQQLNIDTFF